MLLSFCASGHGTNPESLIIRLAGKTVYVTATPRAAVFDRFDTNENGRISRKELSGQRAAMLDYFNSTLQFKCGACGAKTPLLEDISLPHSHGSKAQHFRVTIRFKLEQAPTYLDVHWADSTKHPFSVRAQRMSPGRLAKQRPLGPPIGAKLTTDHPTVRLFESKPQPPEEKQK